MPDRWAGRANGNGGYYSGSDGASTFGTCYHSHHAATVCKDDDDIQDTEEYVEESPLSLDEVEKEMIRKALERHHGKRKSAAKDLNISERTLYRKIKEYELD